MTDAANHQYIQFTNNRSQLISSNSLHHLTAAGLPMHPHTMAHINDLHHHHHANSMGVAANTPMTTASVALLPHHSLSQQQQAQQHQQQSQQPQSVPGYPGYSLNSSGQLVSNVALKGSESNGLVIEAMSNGMANATSAGAGNTGTAGAHPMAMHTVGYMQPMMEVVWPNSANYSLATPTTVSSTGVGSMNNTPQQQHSTISAVASAGGMVTPNNGNATNYTGSSNANNSYIKPSAGNRSINMGAGCGGPNKSSANNSGTAKTAAASHTQENGHNSENNISGKQTSGGSNNANDYNAVNSYATNNSNNKSSNYANSTGSGSLIMKDKIIKNSRCSSITTHAVANNKNKMYNGMNMANNTSNDGCGSKPKTSTNVNSNKYASNNSFGENYSAKNSSVKNSAACSNNLPPASVHASSNMVVANNNNAANGNNQTYVTKTVNGVQIYALAGNAEMSSGPDNKIPFPIASIGEL